jgi:hypothetical protein
MDGLSQARHAATLVVPAGTWLRDEEAAGSNPATPTQVTGHSLPRDVAFIYAVQQQSTATPTSQAASRGPLSVFSSEPGRLRETTSTRAISPEHWLGATLAATQTNDLAILRTHADSGHGLTQGHELVRTGADARAGIYG